MQCEDGSTFTGVPLHFQYSIMPTKGKYTIYQWQQYVNEIQKNIRSIYKQFNMTMSINNQIISTKLTFCSLEKLSSM
jgi:hypothetical protein